MLKLTRLWAFIFAAIGLIAMLLLATSLTGTHLAPGKPFPFGVNLLAPIQGQSGSLPGGQLFLYIIRIFLVIAWIMLPFLVIYLIISPKARKQFLRYLVRTGPVFLLFIILFTMLRNQLGKQNQAPDLGTGNLNSGLPATFPGLPEFNPNPPSWLIIAGSIMIAALILGLLVTIGLAVWRRRTQSRLKVRLLAEEAQTALESIQAGADLKNTIIKCYVEMSRVVKEKRGVQRAADMTPVEFETKLVGLGLPSIPVHDLTSVFQDVRYGDHVPGEREERQAILSLSAIVDSCRGAV